ncbi:MAG: TetR/AcrR family transcriptional regulator [Myxococcota bacterium]|nr:TetR/AcrR family transcriptional regulator [Myxococcota bacterium]
MYQNSAMSNDSANEIPPDPNSSGAGLREKNIELRRERILGAARLLLSRGGLGALSMRKLAEEASLSVNTLYNLWGTREEILRALTLDARDRMEASLPKDESSGDPVEYCRSLVRASVRETCRQHELFRPMMLAWLEGEIGGHPSPIEPMDQAIKLLSGVIREGRTQGFLESTLRPEQVAWQIHHCAQFASVQWALGRIDDAQFEARALYGLNLAFLGLVPAERRPEIQSKLKGLERKLENRPVAEEEDLGRVSCRN